MIKSKIISVILAVVIFIVGVFCGLFIDRLFFSYRMHPRFRLVNEHKRSRMSDLLISRFSKELDLTKEQSESLSQIVSKYKLAMKKLREEIRPKFEELRNSMNKEIISILNDKQKEKFNKMTERHKKIRKRFEIE